MNQSWISYWCLYALINVPVKSTHIHYHSLINSTSGTHRDKPSFPQNNPGNKNSPKIQTPYWCLHVQANMLINLIHIHF